MSITLSSASVLNVLAKFEPNFQIKVLHPEAEVHVLFSYSEKKLTQSKNPEKGCGEDIRKKN